MSTIAQEIEAAINATGGVLLTDVADIDGPGHAVVALARWDSTSDRAVQVNADVTVWPRDDGKHGAAVICRYPLPNDGVGGRCNSAPTIAVAITSALWQTRTELEALAVIIVRSADLIKAEP